MNDYQGAISDFSYAIELRPNDPIHYYNRGISKAKLQDNIGALADYDRTIALDPKYRSAYTNRGILRIQMGQKDAGCMDLSKAGELGDQKAYEAIRKYCNQ
jgi:tetratricopeptide (TPR) repeat protein